MVVAIFTRVAQVLEAIVIGSTGTLGEPFADKIAQRLKHAKLH